ncbi:hypothetical protein FF38_00961 [Lucilia cuprina]|uniref:Kazal-like domain-containing protein n=1 Tax=Lucilia cuprina TaxID=7375 RepID=A0A0L0BUB0_LUCCU|nr:hypothetical protein FF38_00961 [Lucilia cuprina]
MKYIFVSLTASLAIMVLTQAKPLPQSSTENPPCQMPTICGRRADGTCQLFFNKCQFDNTNCRLNYDSKTMWTQVDKSRCSKLTSTGSPGPCS